MTTRTTTTIATNNSISSPNGRRRSCHYCRPRQIQLAASIPTQRRWGGIGLFIGPGTSQRGGNNDKNASSAAAGSLRTMEGGSEGRRELARKEGWRVKERGREKNWPASICRQRPVWRGGRLGAGCGEERGRAEALPKFQEWGALPLEEGEGYGGGGGGGGGGHRGEADFLFALLPSPASLPLHPPPPTPLRSSGLTVFRKKLKLKVVVFVGSTVNLLFRLMGRR